MQDEAQNARTCALENKLNLLFGVLVERGTLGVADVRNIEASAADLAKHGVKATAPGADITSKAINDLLNRIEGLKPRKRR